MLTWLLLTYRAENWVVDLQALSRAGCWRPLRRTAMGNLQFTMACVCYTGVRCVQCVRLERLVKLNCCWAARVCHLYYGDALLKRTQRRHVIGNVDQTLAPWSSPPSHNVPAMWIFMSISHNQLLRLCRWRHTILCHIRMPRLVILQLDDSNQRPKDFHFQK